MPVILDEETERVWIDPAISLEKTLSFLRPYEEDKMYAEEVDRNLFRKDQDLSENTLF
jgi:putative SOS response-associated peptidase YedK